MAENPGEGELGRLSLSTDVDNSGLASGMEAGERIVARSAQRQEQSLARLRTAARSLANAGEGVRQAFEIASRALQGGATAQQAIDALRGMGANAAGIRQVQRALLDYSAEIRKNATEARRNADAQRELMRAMEAANRPATEAAAFQARSQRPEVERRLREATRVANLGPIEFNAPAGRFQRSDTGRFVAAQDAAVVQQRQSIRLFGEQFAVTQQNEHALRGLARVEAELDERQRLLRNSIIGTAQAAARQATELQQLEDRSRPAALAAERLASVNERLTVRVAGRTRQVTDANREQLEARAREAGERRVREHLLQSPFTELEEGPLRAQRERERQLERDRRREEEARVSEAERSARSTPEALAARAAELRQQAARARGAVTSPLEPLGQVRVGGEAVDVTRRNAEAITDLQRAAQQAADAQRDLEQSTIGVARAEEAAARAAAEQRRELEEMAQRSTAPAIEQLRELRRRAEEERPVTRVAGQQFVLGNEAARQQARGFAREEGERSAAARLRAQEFDRIKDAAEKAALSEAHEAEVAERSRVDAIRRRLTPTQVAAAESREARQAARNLPDELVGRRVRIGTEELRVNRENVAFLEQLARGAAAAEDRVIDLDRATAQLGQRKGGPTTLADQLSTLTRNGEQSSSVIDRIGAALGKFDSLFSGQAGQNIRLFAGLAGIPIGLSVIFSVARLLHDVVADALNNEIEWERTARSVNAIYGARGRLLRDFAQAQSRIPGLNVDRETLARATVGLQQTVQPPAAAPGQVDLGGRFELTDAQARQLALQAARLQTLHPELDVDALSQAFRQAIGGQQSDTLERIGLRLSPEDLAERVFGPGNRSAAIFEQAVPPRQRAQVAIEEITRQVARQEANRRAAGGGADERLTAQERVGQIGRTAAETIGEGVGTFIASPITRGIAALADRIGDQNVLRAGTIFLPVGIQGIAQRSIDRAESDQKQAEATRQAAEAADTAAEAQRNLNTTYLQAAAAAERAAASQIRFLENLAAGQARIAREQQLAQALEGPEILTATPEDIALAARHRANAAAQQVRDREDARRVEDAERARLQVEATPTARTRERGERLGPGDAFESERFGAARRQLAEADRRAPIETRLGELQQAQERQGLVTGTAQAALDAQERQRQRRQLAAGVQQAAIQERILTAEGQMAPVQLAQAELQDRITLAQRTNLDLTRARLQAERELLAPSERLADLQFQGNEALLELRANAANRALGINDPNFDRAAAVERIRQSRLRTPQAELDQARAQRGVDLVQRAEARDSNARAQRLTDLETESRALEDQARPLEANLRLENARLQAVARRVALEEAQEEPNRARLQGALLAAEQQAAETEQEIRRSRAQLAGVPLPEPPAANATPGQLDDFTRSISAAMADTQVVGKLPPITVNLNVDHYGMDVDYDLLREAAATGTYLGITRVAQEHVSAVPATVGGGR